MTRRLRGVIFCAIASAWLPAAAQQIKSATVDLQRGVFTSAVPFDEEFEITGSVDAAVQAIDVIVTKLGRTSCRTPVAVSACATTEDANPEWIRKPGQGAANFSVFISRLDPNTCYAFHFIQHIAPASEDERKKVREMLSARFRKLVADAFKPGTFTANQDKEIRAKLAEVAKQAVKTQLQACLPKDEFTLSDEDFEKAKTQILRLTATAQDVKKNIADRRESFKNFLCDSNCKKTLPSSAAKHLRDGLSRLLSNPEILTRGALDAWRSPVNPAREGHEKTTMIHVARAIVSSTNQELAELVDGQRRITGSSLEPVADTDIVSIALFSDFLDAYASDNFRIKASGAGPTVPAVDPRAAIQWRLEAGDLARLLTEQQQTKQALDKTTLPDFLADRVLDRGFNVSTQPTVITEAKNPYIGADFGIGYAANIDKPFLYVGANFYRAPYNKAANDIPALDWRRRGSVLAGMTTNGLDGQGIKNLFGPGNLMLGVGWRPFRYVKVSGGAVVFKQRDENPIVDKEHLKTAPFGSISFDVDLKQFIGGVGKLFGL